MTLRLVAGVEADDLMLVMVIGPNYYTQRVYQKNLSSATPNWTDYPYLSNAGPHLWGGDGDFQFYVNAYLYELYANEHVDCKFVPSSFAGFGS